MNNSVNISDPYPSIFILRFGYTCNNKCVHCFVEFKKTKINDLPLEKLTRIFLISNGVDMIINICMYTYAYKAVKTHKITVYNTFNWILMASIFSRIVISYLNM